VTLPGPSRTIIVEPLEAPEVAPPPSPEREPAPSAPEREPEPREPQPA
jgi:hypothetical protein